MRFKGPLPSTNDVTAIQLRSLRVNEHSNTRVPTIHHGRVLTSGPPHASYRPFSVFDLQSTAHSIESASISRELKIRVYVTGSGPGGSGPRHEDRPLFPFPILFTMLRKRTPAERVAYINSLIIRWRELMRRLSEDKPSKEEKDAIIDEIIEIEKELHEQGVDAWY